MRIRPSNIEVDAIELNIKYLRAASTAFFSFFIDIIPQAAIVVISTKTYKLKRSLVKIMPSIAPIKIETSIK